MILVNLAICAAAVVIYLAERTGGRCTKSVFILFYEHMSFLYLHPKSGIQIVIGSDHDLGELAMQYLNITLVISGQFVQKEQVLCRYGRGAKDCG